jgi:diguanylate cyclase (GGDEF)-like protein
MVARLAGDEFVVVLEGMHDDEECHVIANKVNAAARGPIDFEGEQLTVTTSIGMAYLPAGRRCSAEELLSLADGALYRTKERGRDGYTTVMVGEGEMEFVTSDFSAL